MSENTAKGVKIPEQRVLKDLQRYRKRSDVEIDYKVKLAKAREEKYAGIDSLKILSALDNEDFIDFEDCI